MAIVLRVYLPGPERTLPPAAPALFLRRAGCGGEREKGPAVVGTDWLAGPSHTHSGRGDRRRARGMPVRLCLSNGAAVGKFRFAGFLLARS